MKYFLKILYMSFLAFLSTKVVAADVDQVTADNIKNAIKSVYDLPAKKIYYVESAKYSPSKYCALMSKHFYRIAVPDMSENENKKPAVKDIYGNLVSSQGRKSQCDWVKEFAYNFTHRIEAEDSYLDDEDKHPAPVINRMILVNGLVKASVTNALDFSKNPFYNYADIFFKSDADNSWKICQVNYIEKPVKGVGGKPPLFDLKKLYDGPEHYVETGDYETLGGC
jgi:hypothetical protein